MSHRRNKPRPQNNKRQNNQKTLRRWHRWVGYISLVLVLILSLTGLILNRTESLNLNQITLKNSIIASLYGLNPEQDPLHYAVGENWISWLEGRLYLDSALLAQNTDKPVGAVQIDEVILIGSETSLSLYMADGTLIEKLDQSSLPGKIIALGKSAQGSLLIKNDSGQYVSDQEFTAWTAVENTHGTIFSQSSSPPQQITEKIIQDYQGQGVSLYRLMLDLHSGHIFGSLGPYLMDFAAISLIFLGITGLMKRRPNGKDKRQRKNNS